MNQGKGTVSQAEIDDAKERFIRIRARFAEADRQQANQPEPEANKQPKSESTLTKRKSLP